MRKLWFKGFPLEVVFTLKGKNYGTFLRGVVSTNFDLYL